MKKVLFISILAFLAFLGCSQDDTEFIKEASSKQKTDNISERSEVINGGALTIDLDGYNNEKSIPYEIESVQVEGNRLNITFRSGGCSGEFLDYKLVASDNVIATLPPKRYIRMILKNEELCNAIIRKTVSFDLSVLKFDQSLLVKGYDKEVFYKLQLKSEVKK